MYDMLHGTKTDDEGPVSIYSLCPTEKGWLGSASSEMFL